MADNPNAVREAIEGFACEINGELFVVNAGVTRVAANHPLAQRYPENFRSVEDGLAYEVEAATAEPSEVRVRPVVVEPDPVVEEKTPPRVPKAKVSHGS